MRWCATAALNTDCRATWDSSRTYPRIPAPRIATIDVSVSASTIVGGITVDGLEIMNAATGSSSSNSTLATQIRDAINACSNAKPSVTSPCQTVGYSATVSGATVTIYAPGITNSKPVPHTSAGTAITTLGTISTFDRSPIPLPYWRDTGVTPNQSSAAIPGENLRHTITPFVTSYTQSGGPD